MENDFSEWMVVKDEVQKSGFITKFPEGHSLPDTDDERFSPL